MTMKYPKNFHEIIMMFMRFFNSRKIQLKFPHKKMLKLFPHKTLLDDLVSICT
jgi:hypothetical protein